MTNSNFLDDIRNLVANNQLKEVLQKLQLFLEGQPKLDEAIIQSGRFSELQEKIRKGIINEENVNLQMNQLRASILDLLNELEGKGTSNLIKEAAAKAQIIQNAEKIYNIEKIDKADFS